MTHIHKAAAAPQALQPFKAPAGTGFCQPTSFRLVYADSPAICVMTDLKQVSAATIGPEATLGVVEAGRLRRDETLDRDFAVGVVQGGEEPAQRGQRIRGGTAVHAGVHPVRERAYLDQAGRDAAQARGQRRRPDLGVVGVRQHDDI